MEFESFYGEVDDDLELSPIYSQRSSSIEDLSSSQSQKLYSGLLSKPDFNIFDINNSNSKIHRDVKISSAFQPYTLRDFMSFGPKPRSARGIRNKSKKFTSSRQVRIFQSRLRDYRSILENKISKLSLWKKCTAPLNICTISSLSPILPDEDQKSVRFGWDNDQGIGFREFDNPIVLIGYIIKKAPPNMDKIFGLCAEVGVIPIPLRTNKDMCLYLEDETSRIRLGLSKQKIETLKYDEIVSGVPVGIMGTTWNGKLWVDDVLYATPLDPEWPIVTPEEALEMVFVSGLNFNGEGTNQINVDLLFDYLQGLSGSVVEQEKILKQKTRVFFVGNLFPKRPKWNPDNGENLAKDYIYNVAKLDSMLEDLSRTSEVFVVPGENDLTHQRGLPQPPFHRQLFPESAERPTFQRLSNPAQVNVSLAKPLLTNSNYMEDMEEEIGLIDDNLINIVLTSGTNVKETMQACDIECPIEMSSKLLEWAHLHPTSVADNDLAEEVFSLKGSLPHLLVVGGLREFKTKTWNNVKIIGLPSFAQTNTVVVLTKNCDIVPLSFKISNFKQSNLF